MNEKRFRIFVSALVLGAGVAIAGCHSHHIDSLIDNRTGAAIQQVEVDYPSASFGIDSLAAGQVYKYKLKVQGSGFLKVQYTDSAGKLIHLQGTPLSEGDEGQYLVILLPDGQAQWVPSLEKKN